MAAFAHAEMRQHTRFRPTHIAAAVAVARQVDDDGTETEAIAAGVGGALLQPQAAEVAE